MSKKFLVFGIHDKLGGVETYFINLLKNTHGIKFDFVSTVPRLCFENYFRNTGSRIYRVTDFHRNPIAYARQINSILKNGDYDAVYYNMLSAANIIPLWLAHFRGIKRIIAHSHNAGTPSRYIKAPLNRLNRQFVNRYATDRCACSTEAAMFLFGASKNILIIPNAIDTDRFQFKACRREETRKTLKIQNKIVIGTVGRFSKQKNSRRILKIFFSFLQSHPTAKLLMIGSGELYPKLREDIASFGIDSSVIFTGNVKNVEDMLNAMDVFLLPSLFEGLPIALLEAQACGLPSLVSDTVSKESKVNDTTKYLSLDDADSIWASMIKTVSDSERDHSSRFFANSEWTLQHQVPLLQSFLER